MFAPASVANSQQPYLPPSSHSDQRSEKPSHPDKAAQAPADPVRDARPSVVYIHSQRFERVDTYSSSSVGGSKPVEETAAVEPSELAEAAAATILGFIERQLQLDTAEGASGEQLTSRLESGLEGFLQGFAEASEQLDAAGLLTDEMKTEIQGTYDLVMSGVANLEERYLDGGSISRPEPAIVSAPVQSTQAAYARTESAQSSQFSFELTTADGDTVTIHASSLEAMLSESLARETQGANGQLGFREHQQAYYQGTEFSLKVDGELDDHELSAINDLLGQVRDLSETFFSGDLDGAFEEALGLGYDSSAIADFSLNLSQTSVKRVTEAYQQFAPAQPEQAAVAGAKVASLNERLQPLGSFVQGLLDTLESASRFSAPGSLIEQLAEFFDRDENPRFQSSVSQLLAGLNVE